jgi:hypothetical protein
LNVGKGEATANRVDPDSAFADILRCRLVDGSSDELSGLSFASWRDTVLQIVGYAVGCEGAGLVEELLRGAGDYEKLLGCVGEGVCVEIGGMHGTVAAAAVAAPAPGGVAKLWVASDLP